MSGENEGNHGRPRSPEELEAIIALLEAENIRLKKENEDLKGQVEESKYNDLVKEALQREPFVKTVKERIVEAHRDGMPSAFIDIDFDKFKKINDFGHPFGDRMLQILGKAVRLSTRRTDYFGRLGGEEFEIFLRNTNALGAVFVCEKINDSLRMLLTERERIITRLGVQASEADLSQVYFEFIVQTFGFTNLEDPDIKQEIAELIKLIFTKYPEGFNPYQTISAGISEFIPQPDPIHKGIDAAETYELKHDEADRASIYAKSARHGELEYNIKSSTTTGKIAIYGQPRSRIINPNIEYLKLVLSNTELDETSIRDWFTAAVTRGFDRLLSEKEHATRDLVSTDKFMRIMNIHEEHAVNIFRSMSERQAPAQEIENVLLSYVLSLSTPTLKPDQLVHI
jgi:diguanylate cyclase (GGDEF)-like protein